MRTMEAARPRTILPGPIRQNGYVVRDLDRAIDAWLDVGVGPWLVLPHLTQTGSVYRGQPTEPVVSIAFANSGELQVELIEQEGASPSIYREFLEATRDSTTWLGGPMTSRARLEPPRAPPGRSCTRATPLAWRSSPITTRGA